MVLGYVTILEAMASILQTIKTSVFSSSSLQEWPQTTLICLLLVCGGPCGEITCVMSQCHWDVRGLGGKCVCVAPCHWERKTCWRKRGVSLVSGIIGVFM